MDFGRRLRNTSAAYAFRVRMEMDGEPIDWNVVVVGAWNPAILNPQRIALNLFKLEKGTPVVVSLALDGVDANLRVKYGDVTVAPAPGRLLVQAEQSNRIGMRDCASVAANAMTWLKETPLVAAGVNFRYAFSSLPDPLLRLVECPLDVALADSAREVVVGSVKRSIRWNDGALNLEIEQRTDASGIVAFNFHLDGASGDTLIPWVGRVDEMAEDVRAVARDLLQLTNLGGLDDYQH